MDQIDAIETMLLGPFAENDYVPGNIEDAVEMLRALAADHRGAVEALREISGDGWASVSWARQRARMALEAMGVEPPAERGR